MMYQIFKPLFLFSIAFMGVSKPPVFQLNVKLNNVILHRGRILVAIYNNEHNFLKKPLQKKIINSGDFNKDIIFKELGKGTYAVSLFQDLDENYKLNKVFSVPTEPYGLSNNPGRYPTWEETKFTITKNTKIIITLKN